MYACTGVLALRRRTTYILVYILYYAILYGAKGSFTYWREEGRKAVGTVQGEGAVSCTSFLPQKPLSLRLSNFSDMRSSVRCSTVLRKYVHTSSTYPATELLVQY